MLLTSIIPLHACCTVEDISETLNTHGPVFAFHVIAFTFIMILKKMNS